MSPILLPLPQAISHFDRAKSILGTKVKFLELRIRLSEIIHPRLKFNFAQHPFLLLQSNLNL